MPDINMISHYGSRMKAHISQGIYAMEEKFGLKNDKAALMGLCGDLLRDLSRIVEECTGKSDMLNGSFDSIKDDLSDAFDDLIEAEESLAEQEREEAEYSDFPSRAVVRSASVDGARL
jgi:hypothetical protein